MANDIPQVPSNAVIGWAGAGAVLGRTSNSLKASFNKGKLDLNPVRIGNVLYFDIEELEQFKQRPPVTRGRPPKHSQ